MKLLALSDMHGDFDRWAAASLPPADVCVLAGDFTNYGTRDMREVECARAWVESLCQKYDRVWYVLGNHDIGMTRPFDDLWKCHLSAAGRPVSVWDLEEQGAPLVDDLRFVGINLSPCFAAPELKATWTKMTDDPEVDAAAFASLPPAEIVVSHCPPLGYVDYTFGTRNRRHIGSPGLLEYIKREQPLLVISGHVHEAAGFDVIVHPNGRHTDIYNVARTPTLIDVDRPRFMTTYVETGEPVEIPE